MAEATMTVRLEDLKPNPYQPEGRIEVPDDEAQELAGAILANGYQAPIVRMTDQGDYEVGDGWRRVTAFRWLAANGHPEYNDIRVDVRDISDELMSSMVIAYNTKRKDLDELQLARQYKAHIEKFGITQQAFADSIGKSQGEVANTIRLLELPDELQAKVISQEISPTHARQLLRLTRWPDRQKVEADELMRRPVSVNELSNRIQHQLFSESKPLEAANEYNNANPAFDTAGCQGCEHAEKVGSPYSNNKKVLRCLNPECWNKKQEDARKAVLETARESAGLELFSLGERPYGDWKYLYHYWLEAHPECGSCPRRAGMMDLNGQVTEVCNDVTCYQKKERADRRQEQISRREQEEQRKKRIDDALDNLTDIALGTRTAILIALGDCDLPEMLGMEQPEEDEAEGAGGEDIDDIMEKRARENLESMPLLDLIKFFLRHQLEAFRFREIDDYLRPLEAAPRTMTAEMEKAIGPADSLEFHEWKDNGPSNEELGIPAGVRRAEDVPDEECRSCKLDTRDHTLGHRFMYGNTSYKVCLKDWRVYEKRERMKKGLAASQASETGGNGSGDRTDHPDDPLATLVIHVGIEGGGRHYLRLGNRKWPGVTLIECVLGLGREMGWGASADAIIEAINKMPDSSNKRILINILSGALVPNA